MDIGPVPFVKKNGEDRVSTENNDHEQNTSLNNKREDQIPPKETQVDNRTPSKESCEEVCKFEDIDSINLITKQNYTVASCFGLTAWRMLPIDCVFDTDDGHNML